MNVRIFKERKKCSVWRKIYFFEKVPFSKEERVRYKCGETHLILSFRKSLNIEYKVVRVSADYPN